MLLRRSEPVQELLRPPSAGDHEDACGYNNREPEEVLGFYSADHRLPLSAGGSPFKTGHFPAIAVLFLSSYPVEVKKIPGFLESESLIML